jgi:DNA mismatch endonuclease (patch repair protein)
VGLTRSEVMRRIRGANTRPERVLGAALWSRGHRYRLRSRNVAGRPDLTFSKCRLAVFVDGCFWHGCPDHYVRPRSREDFWAAKLRENVQRDLRQTRELADAGWTVVRVWEHEVFTHLAVTVRMIERAMRAGCHRPRRAEWRVLSAVPIAAASAFEDRVLVSLADPQREKNVQIRRHTRKW